MFAATAADHESLHDTEAYGRRGYRDSVTTPQRERFRAGMRLGVGFGVATGVVGIPCGLLATSAGLSPSQGVVMSLLVFAGSAQFAALSIVAGGGAVSAAVTAAALMNSRFLAMGAAIAPSLPGGPIRRALQGQAVVDTSWAAALRPDGSFDRYFMFGATLPQYLGWATGTAVGAYGSGLVPDVEALGLDAVFPAFFLALLISEVRNRRGLFVAVGGAGLALALVPAVPPGLPILLAGLAAVAGVIVKPRESA
jgi:4-azaleucine resistance transporter AzlC